MKVKYEYEIATTVMSNEFDLFSSYVKNELNIFLSRIENSSVNFRLPIDIRLSILASSYITALEENMMMMRNIIKSSKLYNCFVDGIEKDSESSNKMFYLKMLRR